MKRKEKSKYLYRLVLYKGLTLYTFTNPAPCCKKLTYEKDTKPKNRKALCLSIAASYRNRVNYVHKCPIKCSNTKTNITQKRKETPVRK